MHVPSAPISYAVELTWDCQHACPGCANVPRTQRDNVLHDWKGLLDAIAPPGNRRQYAELIRLTGGEPTLHPEFADILRYVDSFGIPHATFTNGLWQQPDRFVETWQACRHFVGLLVSVHGSTAGQHRVFTHADASGAVPTAFDSTCANIRQAAKAGLDVFTNTVLTRANWDRIEEMVALSQDLGAGCAVFNRYLGKPHALEPEDRQLRQAIETVERLQAAGAACHLGNCIPPCFCPNSSPGANEAIEHCVIAPDGAVRPDSLTAYTFGNLFELPISAIWHSEQAEWYRRQIPAACGQCVELPRCRGGCKAVAVEHHLTGDRVMTEPILEASPKTLEIDQSWIPVPHFHLREETFGYLLCRYNWSVPVSQAAKPLLDWLDGRHTVAQFHQQFGDDALTFIGHLYQEGCIELTVDPSVPHVFSPQRRRDAEKTQAEKRLFSAPSRLCGEKT